MLLYYYLGNSVGERTPRPRYFAIDQLKVGQANNSGTVALVKGAEAAEWPRSRR